MELAYPNRIPFVSYLTYSGERRYLDLNSPWLLCVGRPYIVPYTALSGDQCFLDTSLQSVKLVGRLDYALSGTSEGDDLFMRIGNNSEPHRYIRADWYAEADGPAATGGRIYTAGIELDRWAAHRFAYQRAERVETVLRERRRDLDVSPDPLPAPADPLDGLRALRAAFDAGQSADEFCSAASVYADNWVERREVAVRRASDLTDGHPFVNGGMLAYSHWVAEVEEWRKLIAFEPQTPTDLRGWARLQVLSVALMHDTIGPRPRYRGLNVYRGGTFSPRYDVLRRLAAPFAPDGRFPPLAGWVREAADLDYPLAPNASALTPLLRRIIVKGWEHLRRVVDDYPSEPPADSLTTPDIVRAALDTIAGTCSRAESHQPTVTSQPPISKGGKKKRRSNAKTDPAADAMAYDRYKKSGMIRADYVLKHGLDADDFTQLCNRHYKRKSALKSTGVKG